MEKICAGQAVVKNSPPLNSFWVFGNFILLLILLLLLLLLLLKKQCVIIDRVKSRFFSVLSGIPQGMVIAGLLFLIFINDLPL